MRSFKTDADMLKGLPKLEESFLVLLSARLPYSSRCLSHFLPVEGPMLISGLLQICRNESSFFLWSKASKNFIRLIVSNSLCLIFFGGVCGSQLLFEAMRVVLFWTVPRYAHGIMQPLVASFEGVQASRR